MKRKERKAMKGKMGGEEKTKVTLLYRPKRTLYLKVKKRIEKNCSNINKCK